MSPTTSLSLAQLKSAAKRYRSEQAQKGIELSHQKSLSELSQILFGRSYEDIQKTRFVDPEDAPRTVRLIGYKGRFHVAVQGELVPARRIIQGVQCSAQEARSAMAGYAKGEANRLGVLVHATGLPYWLPEGKETEESVVALARSLGVLQDPSVIMDLVGTRRITVNGEPQARLSPMNEWAPLTTGTVDPAVWSRQVVWSPVIEGAGVDLTVEDLANAKTMPGRAVIEKKGRTLDIRYAVPIQMSPKASLPLVLGVAGQRW